METAVSVEPLELGHPLGFGGTVASHGHSCSPAEQGAGASEGAVNLSLAHPGPSEAVGLLAWLPVSVQPASSSPGQQRPV